VALDLRNPLKDKLFKSLYDKNSKFPARIQKKRLKAQIVTEKTLFQESD
jgi:hypothetical protein